jgi:hypothetical protein
MMPYSDKEEKLDDVKGYVQRRFSNLHPTDRADAHREMGKWSEDQAKQQDAANDRHGVPDRDVEPEVSDD